MNDYKHKVIEAYSKANESQRASLAGEFGMEFIYTKKIMKEYIDINKKVVEVGCGGGYYGLHFADKCYSYHGIDLTPFNIQVFQEKIDELELSNVSTDIGDATNLIKIEDESYDVVMCLGPMYHLNREDRYRCISECRRICKVNGIITFTYINKTGAIAKFGTKYGWESLLNEKISEYVLDKGTDDVYTDIFYYLMPEEIESDAKFAGLNIIKNVGLDILLDADKIASLTEEQRKVWFKIADLMNNSPSCMGVSNHALLICKKNEYTNII